VTPEEKKRTIIVLRAVASALGQGTYLDGPWGDIDELSAHSELAKTIIETLTLPLELKTEGNALRLKSNRRLIYAAC